MGSGTDQTNDAYINVFVNMHLHLKRIRMLMSMPVRMYIFARACMIVVYLAKVAIKGRENLSVIIWPSRTYKKKAK